MYSTVEWDRFNRTVGFIRFDYKGLCVTNHDQVYVSTLFIDVNWKKKYSRVRQKANFIILNRENVLYVQLENNFSHCDRGLVCRSAESYNRVQAAGVQTWPIRI